MCTVSIVPTARGLRLACNRDEQRTRPPALPPRLWSIGERRVVFPLDPQGGGTWVGANDAALVAALLNRNASVSVSADGRERLTRGQIVPSLLAADTLDLALEAVEALDPTSFLPFRLIVAAGHEIVVMTSDARVLTVKRGSLVRPLMFTTSSLGDARVHKPRRRLFNRLVQRGQATSGHWLAAQRAFHRHHWPSHPELSVRMTRADAMTVSQTTIDVTRGRLALVYESFQDASASSTPATPRLRSGQVKC